MIAEFYASDYNLSKKYSFVINAILMYVCMYLFCSCGVQTDSRSVYKFLTRILNLFILIYFILIPFISIHPISTYRAPPPPPTHTHRFYLLFPFFKITVSATLFLLLLTLFFSLFAFSPSFSSHHPIYTFTFIPFHFPFPLSHFSHLSHPHLFLSFSSFLIHPSPVPSLAYFPHSCVPFVSSDSFFPLPHHYRICSHFSSSHPHTLHNLSSI